MISSSSFFFSKARVVFLSAIMQLNNDECSRWKRERKRENERTTNGSGKQILKWKRKPKQFRGWGCAGKEALPVLYPHS